MRIFCLREKTSLFKIFFKRSVWLHMALFGHCPSIISIEHLLMRHHARCQRHRIVIYYDYWASLMDQTVKNPPAMQETWVQSLGQEDPLEEGMATHSSILAWRIPWTEEPGEPQSMRSPRVRHDWAPKHRALLLWGGGVISISVHCLWFFSPSHGVPIYEKTASPVQNFWKFSFLSHSSIQRGERGQVS